MHLIDSHIHLDFPVFDTDRERCLQVAERKGIKTWVIPGTEQATFHRIQALSARPGCFVAYGLHPYFERQHENQHLAELDRWLSLERVVAVGEIGLDFFLKTLSTDRQQHFFDAQLEMANAHKLPVILHARKAVEAVTLALRHHRVSGGIVHSYNGSYEQAVQLLDLGFMLGFGGALTFPRATRLRALFAKLPIDAIVLETDAPDQPPLAYQGKRNEPAALASILDTACALRQMSRSAMAIAASQNTLAALPKLAESGKNRPADRSDNLGHQS